MNGFISIKDELVSDTKGVTPQYAEYSKTMVLNQKCVRNGVIDYSFAQYVSAAQAIPVHKHIKIGDLLLNSTGEGTAGRCALVRHVPNGYIVTVDSHMLILRFSSITWAEFFAYALHKEENLLLTLLTGSSGQGELDRERVYNIAFPFTDNNLNIFGKIYTAINSQIELNNKITAELEAMAKLLYEYWFVQFDFPDKNGRPYKSSGGAMKYIPELKREIPYSWLPGIAKDILSFNPTTLLKSRREAPYIDMGSLPLSGFMPRMPILKTPCGGQRFKNGDVLLARITPCLENGKTGIVLNLADDESVGFGSTEFIVIRGKKQNYRAFSACLARSEQFRKYAIVNMTGTSGRKRVDADDLKIFPMPIPPQPLLEIFEERVFPFFKIMVKNAKENEHLNQLRDWLLPMLMNGQIKVKAAAQKCASPIAIPAEPRSTKKQIDYGLQLAFAALKQSGGYIKLNAIADIFAALGSPSEMSGMVLDGEEKSAWQKNMPNFPVNNALLIATIDRLIKYGLVALRTVNGAKELVMIGDWPIEETDDKWIDLDAHLAMQAIANWDERIRIQNQLFIEFRKIFDEAQFAVAA